VSGRMASGLDLKGTSRYYDSAPASLDTPMSLDEHGSLPQSALTPAHNDSEQYENAILLVLRQI
jgi:hypothetical protein